MSLFDFELIVGSGAVGVSLGLLYGLCATCREHSRRIDRLHREVDADEEMRMHARNWRVDRSESQ